MRYVPFFLDVGAGRRRLRSGARASLRPILTALNLSAGSMALSILGFNLGIELMQISVIAMAAPWLILLSVTLAHGLVRVGVHHWPQSPRPAG